MSQENVEVVREAIAALNALAVERYLSLCTAAVEKRPSQRPRT